MSGTSVRCGRGVARRVFLVSVITAVFAVSPAVAQADITDTPCPFGLYGNEVTPKGTGVSFTTNVPALNSMLAKEYEKRSALPLATPDILPAADSSDKRAESTSDDRYQLWSEYPPSAELKRLLDEVEKFQDGESTITPDLPQRISRLAGDVLRQLQMTPPRREPGEPARARYVLPEKLQEELETLILEAELTDRRPLTPARPLGKKQIALSVSLAPAEFDTADGDELPEDRRVESWLSWAAVGAGVTKRIDVSALVSYYSLDVPSGWGPNAGHVTGQGDTTVGTRVRVGSSGRSAFAVHASVTAPTADDRRLGTDDWWGRAGFAVDRVLVTRYKSSRSNTTPSARPLLVYSSFWGLWREGGRQGGGFSVGLDYSASRTVAIVGGVSGEIVESSNDYIDAHGGVRIRGAAARRLAGPQLDGLITLRWALNDEGIQPNSWLNVAVQVVWDRGA